MPRIPFNPALLTTAAPAANPPGGTGGEQLIAGNLAKTNAAIAAAQQGLQIAGGITQGYIDKSRAAERKADIAGFEAEWGTATAEARAKIDALPTTDASGKRSATLDSEIQRIWAERDSRVDRWKGGMTGGIPHLRHPDVRADIDNYTVAAKAEDEIFTAASVRNRLERANAERFALRESQIIADPSPEAEKALERLAKERLAAGDEPAIVAARMQAATEEMQRRRWANSRESVRDDAVNNSPMLDAYIADLESELENPQGDFGALSQDERGRMRRDLKALVTEAKAQRATADEQLRADRTAEFGKLFAAGKATMDDAYALGGDDSELADKFARMVANRNERMLKPTTKVATEAQKASAVITLERLANKVEGGEPLGLGMDVETAIRMNETAFAEGLITASEYQQYAGRMLSKPDADPTKMLNRQAVNKLMESLDALVAKDDDESRLFAIQAPATQSGALPFMSRDTTDADIAPVAAGLRIGDMPSRYAVELGKADVEILKRDVENYMTANPSATSDEVEKKLGEILFGPTTKVVQSRLRDRYAQLLAEETRRTPEAGGARQ